MDGTSKTILHDTSLSAPYCLTLDYDAQVLYWADYTLNKIERSNADGSNRQLVTTSLVNNAYTITFFNGQLYWTDLSYSRILTAPNTTSSTSSFLTTTFGSMYGIKAIAEDRQPNGKVTS
jgi:sugar lactone lactonase YvrE